MIIGEIIKSYRIKQKITQEEMVEKTHSLGASGFIAKPFSANTVLEQII